MGAGFDGCSVCLSSVPPTPDLDPLRSDDRFTALDGDVFMVETDGTNRAVLDIHIGRIVLVAAFYFVSDF